jgi:hypothetical protein
MSYSRKLSLFGGALALGVILIFFLYLILGVAHVEADNNSQDSSLSTCIQKYKAAVGEATPNVSLLYNLNGFCYDSLGSQLKLDQEQIRRDTFVFQRNETVVLLYMVVLITLAGVLLAGLQLLASYKLASNGHGELAGGGGELTYSPKAVSFKSSVIGLTMLALSFGFFLVFVVYVYNLNDMPAAANAQTSLALGQTPTKLVAVPMGPVSNMPAQTTAANAQMSPALAQSPTKLVAVPMGPACNMTTQTTAANAQTSPALGQSPTKLVAVPNHSRSRSSNAAVPLRGPTCSDLISTAKAAPEMSLR